MNTLITSLVFACLILSFTPCSSQDFAFAEDSTEIFEDEQFISKEFIKVYAVVPVDNIETVLVLNEVNTNTASRADYQFNSLSYDTIKVVFYPGGSDTSYIAIDILADNQNEPVETVNLQLLDNGSNTENQRCKILIYSAEAKSDYKGERNYIALGGSFDFLEGAQRLNTYSELRFSTGYFRNKPLHERLANKRRRYKSRGLKRQKEEKGACKIDCKYLKGDLEKYCTCIENCDNVPEIKTDHLFFKQINRWQVSGGYINGKVNSDLDSLYDTHLIKIEGDSLQFTNYKSKTQTTSDFWNIYIRPGVRLLGRYESSNTLDVTLSFNYIERNITRTITNTPLNTTVIAPVDTNITVSSIPLALSQNSVSKTHEGYIGLGVQFNHSGENMDLYALADASFGYLDARLDTENTVKPLTGGKYREDFYYNINFGIIIKNLDLKLGGDVRGRFNLGTPYSTIYLSKLFSLKKLKSYLPNTY